jgi:hypothetical protein
MNIRKWVTSLRAIDPETNELKTWAGPRVPGLNMEDAQGWCVLNGMGYLTVTGELVCEIDAEGRETDYELEQAN